MCLTPMKNISNYYTPQKSSARSDQNKQDKVHRENIIRCLFTPKRLPNLKKETNIVLSTPARNQFHKSQPIPLFDTPNRVTLTSRDLNEKFSGFTLGRGSFGVVVEGSYKRRRVAVKILKGKSLFRSICQEKNAVHLKHPNIVKVFKVIEQYESNVGFVIMELHGWKSLEDILDTLVPFKVKLKYLKETASALEYCHTKGILHLDVKPKNIVISEVKSSSKLCDFGSSAKVSETRTVRSPTKGTIKYCAPELLKGCMATERADVYSFGITMWQLVHERTPYDKEDLHVIVYKVVACDYRPDSQQTICNDKVESIYTSCWEADPMKRPPMSSVLTMLNDI